MDLYVIRRPSAWADLKTLETAGAKSARIGNEEMPDQVRWIRSYVINEADGRIGTFCVYQAKSPEAIREHARRVGDPNRGGSSTRVPLMTAYRQEALRCAGLLAKNGPMKVAALRLAAEAPKAAAILSADHYGWFERVERGIYGLTPKGRAGLERHGWTPG